MIFGALGELTLGDSGTTSTPPPVVTEVYNPVSKPTPDFKALQFKTRDDYA